MRTTMTKTQQFQMVWNLIENRGEVRHEKYRRTEKSVVFKIEHNFKDFTDLKTFEEIIDNSFEKAIRPMLEDCSPDDQFSAYIEHVSLTPSIFIGYQKVRNFDKKSFLNHLYKIAQSNTTFLLDGVLNVRVAIVNPVEGAGRSSRNIRTYDSVKDQKSLIKINNNNNSCGYIAIAMGIKFHEWNVASDNSQRRWKNLRCYAPNMERLGEEFCNEYNLPIDDKMTIPMINDRIQPALEDEYQIIVINFNDFNQLFIGPDCEKVIYLLYNDNHYDLIKDMASFLNKKFYCKPCNKGYDRVTGHKCDYTCLKCRGPQECKSEDIERICELCEKTFESDYCFDRHLKNKCCTEEKFCPFCEFTYHFDKKHTHKCGEFLCYECNQYYEQQPHNCYMRPLNENQLKKDDEKPKFIVTFDIESMLIEKNNGEYDHKPIYISWYTTCMHCWNNTTMTRNSPICEVCEVGDNEFYGEDCVTIFVKYIISLSKSGEQSKSRYLYICAQYVRL